MLSVKNTLVWIQKWIGSGFKKACIRARIQFTLDPKHHIPEHALLQVRITLMQTRILLVTLMRIRIRNLNVTLMRIRTIPFTILLWGSGSGPSFQIKAQNLESTHIGSYSVHFSFSYVNWCGSGSCLSLWCGSECTIPRTYMSKKIKNI